jgi:predicted AAA+ superfamily ATPase
MMIKRLMSGVLKERLKRFPAAALLGPRQAGKTTLAKTLSTLYYDLEQEEEQLRLDLNWNSIVQSKQLIVLDEAQAMPGIFPRIRGAVDSNRKQHGRFLLLGSVQPALAENVSESLAGRLSICELSPLLLKEFKKILDEDTLWFRGGFPDGGILQKKNFPTWQNDYLTLLAQRDLPAWGLPAKPQMTLRFFKMLAACHGQIWNASRIGSSMGLSYHTVNQYLDYLQNAYLIFVLRPFHTNIRKRLVKSPKIFWRDSGLLHALLGVSSKENLLAEPWVGASWEGWALGQIILTLQTAGESFDAYYFRTSDGSEIDLVLEFSKGRWAFEFKLTSTPSPEDMKRLNAAADLIKTDKRILISKTNKLDCGPNFISGNIRQCLNQILV